LQIPDHVLVGLDACQHTRNGAVLVQLEDEKRLFVQEMSIKVLDE